MNEPVLVFDSGLGGLSIVSTLRKVVPKANLAYVCDNAMMPYGNKEDKWLTDRIIRVCNASIEATSASVLVVACNTASTLALEQLRECLNIPVIGTVPAIKPAALITRTKKIAILATSATLRRPYTQNLIDSYASQCDVFKFPADDLVLKVERIFKGDKVSFEELKGCLRGVLCDEHIDTIVLGCTHFPLVIEFLKRIVPREINWVESSVGVANRVATIIGDVGNNFAAEYHSSFSTAYDKQLSNVLIACGFDAPVTLSIDDIKVVNKI